METTEIHPEKEKKGLEPQLVARAKDRDPDAFVSLM